MLRNYFLTALRSLTRHRFFSVVNVFGLSVAMLMGMVLIMLLADQLTYDRYNSRRSSIYRINSSPTTQKGEVYNETATTPLPLRDELLTNYPVVEEAVRVVRGFGNHWIEFDQNVNIPVAGYFADPGVFDFFEYELEQGDPKTALVEPYSVVLTPEVAMKIFGKTDVLNLTFKVGKSSPYKVTGVLKSTSRKSHIAFDALASIATVEAEEKQAHVGKDLGDWQQYTRGWVYVRLAEGHKRVDLQLALDSITSRQYATAINDQVIIRFKPQALTAITPGPFINNAIGPFFPWVFVYFLGGLALVVLLTACFNFTNLSIARSLSRAREIGVRKVTGAGRGQIVVQFLIESVLLALLSLGISMVLLVIIKPLVLQLSIAQAFRWDLEWSTPVVLAFVGFAVLTGLLAGIFPAVVMSRFQPVRVLKGFASSRILGSRLTLRKALLVTQFSLALFFLISVLVVSKQLTFFLKADHGFSMDHHLVVRLNETGAMALKNELLKYSGIRSVSAASHLPAAGSTMSEGFRRSLHDGDWLTTPYYSVDEDYLDNLQIELKAGEFFKPGQSQVNSQSVILNEKAMHAFGFTSIDEALGAELIRQQDSSKLRVTGVVKDYNHQMLMQAMEPMVLVYDSSNWGILQVSYVGTYAKAGSTLETVWSKVNPGLRVDYQDMNAEIHKLYQILFGDLVAVVGTFSMLAIAISCLGLLGMATYSIESRMKEVSIRKVLGAPGESLVLLLSRGLLLVLLLAMFIAIPLAILVNNLWLQQLAYHVGVDWSVIVPSCLILLIFGIGTMGSQIWKALVHNPVDQLRAD